jgi:phosphoglycerate dehydrogenase-like enzyme
VINRLKPFNIVCVMRERTPLPRAILEQLPNLRLIASTGLANASIDEAAAEALGIAVRHTGYSGTPTIEFTWTLILSDVHNLLIKHLDSCASVQRRPVRQAERWRRAGEVFIDNCARQGIVINPAVAFGI